MPSDSFSCASRRSLLRAVALSPLAAALRPGTAASQDFPTQPIRLVVPFAAGGAVDFVGRLVGQELSNQLGQPVVVENRTGASGAIGAQFVARAPADGHTLMMTPITSFAMLAGLPGNNLGVDLARDFVTVGNVGAVPLVVAVNPRLAVNDLTGLVAYLRANPGRLSFASSGNGSTEHLAAEMFMRITGTEMLHVPYRGGAPALADVIAGQVSVMFATAPNVLQNGSTVKVLAIATARRSAVLPEIPTAAEAGVPGFLVSSIYGLLAPARVSAPALSRLGAALRVTVENPSVRQRLQQQAVDVAYATPEAAAAELAEEVARWGDLIREARISFQ